MDIKGRNGKIDLKLRGVEIPPNFFTLKGIYPCRYYFSFLFFFGAGLDIISHL